MMDWVKHYSVWLGGVGALLTVMGVLNAILSGIKVLEVKQSVNAVEISRLNGTYIALLTQSAETKKECAVLTEVVRNRGESRGQVQDLVNSVVKYLDADENHPR